MKIQTSIIEVPKTNPKIAINKKTLPGQFNNILRKLDITVSQLANQLENHPENDINQDE